MSNPWRTGSRTSKGEKLDNPTFRVVSNHDEQDILPRLLRGGRFLSIDPAQLNYTIRVEWRPGVKSRKQKIITYEYCHTNIAERAQRKGCFITTAVTSFLDRYDFSQVSVAVIERQMVENYKSTWIAHHTYCYLTMTYPDMIVIDLAATFKSKILRAPSGLNKTAIKKWAVERADQILKQRRDHKSLKYLHINGKKDDRADVVVQLEALFVYFSRSDGEVLITDDLYPENEDSDSD
jgi:hypothetical protein